MESVDVDLQVHGRVSFDVPLILCPLAVLHVVMSMPCERHNIYTKANVVHVFRSKLLCRVLMLQKTRSLSLQVHLVSQHKVHHRVRQQFHAAIYSCSYGYRVYSKIRRVLVLYQPNSMLLRQIHCVFRDHEKRNTLLVLHLM